MKVCIVGGVAGGASAAARLRRLDEKAEIIMFERGEYISFANCGLPYHISGKIAQRSSLILQQPESFNRRFNVDVRVKSEVLSIDRENMEITIKNLVDGKEYKESYDKLILSPGAAPFIPPVKGRESDHFMSLRNIPDLDKIIETIKNKNAEKAVVIGGGFIGIEVAENLSEMGIETHLVELMDQVLTPVDREMANILHEKLEEQGIRLHLADGVKEVGEKDVLLNSGTKLQADVVISAVGVKPEVNLAENAGLKIGMRGGIVVDGHMRTSDENIFAAGDAVEVTHYVTETTELIPLAGPANKHGRIIADNICGISSTYDNTQGTGIVKVFNLQVAFTGINEKQAIKEGVAYKAIHLHPANHANYYPGACPLTVKVLFNTENGKVLGAQAIGSEGADKRIDVIATAIRGGMTVYDLENLELAYAPPFGSAKDPVNMAGFVGTNLIKGIVKSVTYDEVDTLDKPLFVDVRTPVETDLGSVPGAVKVPVDDMRERLNELPKDRDLVIYCKVGIRAYIAYRILAQNGYDRVYNLSGGYTTYGHYTWKSNGNRTFTGDSTPSGGCCSGGSCDDKEAETLDLCGVQCPGPIMKIRERLDELENGDRVKAISTDPGFAKDLPAFCHATGNRVINTEVKESKYVAVIEKGAAPVEGNSPVGGGKNKNLIIFSNDLDRAMASFIIANGAKAMGSEVSLFFTFWGLNLLRKDSGEKVKKGLMDRMFGFMMPKGTDRQVLSKMNMMGMGTKMMKMVMKKKNVSSLSELLMNAVDSGIKLVACSMTMDIMGIKQEELIPGVTIGGVAQYLDEADRSNLNLFI